ncbi:MAG: hypothetical protein F6K11_10775, partial [Leptolyngbya sp. SIO3F4]|nr:hypothetical protein [Leptolyngbya sp. SIO3F4]
PIQRNKSSSDSLNIVQSSSESPDIDQISDAPQALPISDKSVVDASISANTLQRQFESPQSIELKQSQTEPIDVSDIDYASGSPQALSISEESTTGSPSSSDALQRQLNSTQSIGLDQPQTGLVNTSNDQEVILQPFAEETSSTKTVSESSQTFGISDSLQRQTDILASSSSDMSTFGQLDPQQLSTESSESLSQLNLAHPPTLATTVQPSSDIPPNISNSEQELSEQQAKLSATIQRQQSPVFGVSNTLSPLTLNQETSQPEIQKVSDTALNKDIHSEKQQTLSEPVLVSNQHSSATETSDYRQSAYTNKLSPGSRGSAERQSMSQSRTPPNSDGSSINTSTTSIQRNVVESPQSKLGQSPTAKPIDVPNRLPESDSIQRVHNTSDIDSIQSESDQQKTAQSVEVQANQSELENIQRVHDTNRISSIEASNASTVAQSQFDRSTLPDDNKAEIELPQLSLSTTGELQRTVTGDSLAYENAPENQANRLLNQEQPQIETTQTTSSQFEVSSGTDVTLQRLSDSTPTAIASKDQLAETSPENLSNPSNRVQRSSDIRSHNINSSAELSGSLTNSLSASQLNTSQTQPVAYGLQSSDSDTGVISDSKKATLHLPNVTSDQINLKTQLSESSSEHIASKSDVGLHNIDSSNKVSDPLINPSNTFQQKQNFSGELLKQDQVIKSQVLSEPAVQRNSSNISKDDLPSHIEPYALSVDDSIISNTLQRQLDSFPSIESQLSNTEHYQTQLPEQQALTTETVDNTQLPTRQAVSGQLPSESTISLQRSSDQVSQSQSLISLGKTTSRAMRDFSSSRQLPRVLKPLGVLKPLPPLQTKQSAIANQTEQSVQAKPHTSTPTQSNPISQSIYDFQAQSNTVQRQDIPNEWSSLESLVTALSDNQQHESKSEKSTDNHTISGIDSLTSKPNGIQRQPSDTDNAANSQQQSNPDKTPRQLSDSKNDTNIQRQSDPDSIPDEWSNLEDLVTHLQSSSDHGAAKAANSKQSTNSTSKSTSQSKQSSQTVKVATPATVTVQRQTAGPASATKPTIIQACNDAAADSPADSSNDKEQDADHDYSQYLELLVQEVYSLLRQRLSLEQERRGPKYPR